MRKHASFRAALVAAFPNLKRNPDRLAVFIDKGRIAARYGATESVGGFEYRYTLVAMLLDFAGDTNLLMATVTRWIHDHQPERLLNHDHGNEAFAFEAEILDSGKADVEIAIEGLTEAIAVAADGVLSYRDEPPVGQEFADVPAGTTVADIIVNGEGLMDRAS